MPRLPRDAMCHELTHERNMNANGGSNSNFRRSRDRALLHFDVGFPDDGNPRGILRLEKLRESR
jgi:hypothetical protein